MTKLSISKKTFTNFNKEKISRMKKLFLIFLTIPTIAFASSGSSTVAHHPKQMKWEFDSIFGRFDRASAQRGYQVYREVCSACHSLELVSYRNLADIGFGEAEIKQIASEFLVEDGPNDEGDMFERAGLAI